MVCRKRARPERAWCGTDAVRPDVHVEVDGARPTFRVGESIKAVQSRRRPMRRHGLARSSAQAGRQLRPPSRLVDPTDRLARDGFARRHPHPPAPNNPIERTRRQTVAKYLPDLPLRQPLNPQHLSTHNVMKHNDIHTPLVLAMQR
jgi:hypothetical protein